jgi:S-methylmethionine-dependent homocysteine/selenocysteine methylase
VPTGYRTDLDVAAYVDYTRRWVEQGAEIIGGCCGIGPEYIDSLQSELAA